MNFSSASKVLQTIQAGDDVERMRGENRQAVNNLFNGAPPLTEEEAKEINLKINVNFGEGPTLAQHARRQYNTAFLQPQNFFKITIPLAPPEKKQEWELLITSKINAVLKASLPYFEVFRQKFASVVSHGIGPMIWYDKESWLPEYVAVEDLRMPSDTRLDMSNVTWFAVRKSYTVGELVKKVYGKNAVDGWNKKVVAKILNQLRNQEYQDHTYDWDNAPEKMFELYKQDFGFWSNDAVPTVPMWHFYFIDDENPNRSFWKMRVVPDSTAGTLVNPPDEFIFDNGEKKIADKLSQIIHVQFGDLSSKAPFMYHSIRSLGFLLVEPCFWTNLVRCRWVQHVFENFNVWLQSTDPAGKARAQKVELFDRCFLPEGVKIVPNTERHVVDSGMVTEVMAELRQLQAEASTAYRQDIDTGSSKEQTATEATAKLQTVNALMSGLLLVAFMYERFHYIEVCRRFCLRKTMDADAKRFQDACQKHGIPKVFVDPDMWTVEPEVPLGSGHPTMEILEAQQLMGVRGSLEPQAQQEVTHQFIAAVTRNPAMAERLAPSGKSRQTSDAVTHAEIIFSTLMLGVPVHDQIGLNPIEQIQTLLGLMAGVIARIEQTGSMARQDEIIGLQQVAQYIQGLLKAASQDKANSQRLKQFADALGKLMNAVKGFQQRLQQQQQAQQKAAQQQGGQNGAGSNGAAVAQAKAQETMMLGGVKMKLKQAEGQQKMAMEAARFKAEQHRKDLETMHEMGREDMLLKTKRASAMGGDE